MDSSAQPSSNQEHKEGHLPPNDRNLKIHMTKKGIILPERAGALPNKNRNGDIDSSGTEIPFPTTLTTTTTTTTKSIYEKDLDHTKDQDLTDLITEINSTPPPTVKPSASPTTSHPTTSSPTKSPSQRPTTKSPTSEPTRGPTVPTRPPTVKPTSSTPTTVPTGTKSSTPIDAHTTNPTSSSPTDTPTVTPTSQRPTRSQSQVPTDAHTTNPSTSPTSTPTGVPSTSSPTRYPTFTPTVPPTEIPTSAPTSSPTEVTLLQCDGFQAGVMELTYSYSLEHNIIIPDDVESVDSVRRGLEMEMNKLLADEFLGCYDYEKEERKSGRRRANGSRRRRRRGLDTKKGNNGTDVGMVGIDWKPDDVPSTLTLCTPTNPTTNTCTIYHSTSIVYLTTGSDLDQVRYESRSLVHHYMTDNTDVLIDAVPGLVKATYLGPNFADPRSGFDDVKSKGNPQSNGAVSSAGNGKGGNTFDPVQIMGIVFVSIAGAGFVLLACYVLRRRAVYKLRGRQFGESDTVDGRGLSFEEDDDRDHQCRPRQIHPRGVGGGGRNGGTPSPANSNRSSSSGRGSPRGVVEVYGFNPRGGDPNGGTAAAVGGPSHEPSDGTLSVILELDENSKSSRATNSIIMSDGWDTSLDEGTDLDSINSSIRSLSTSVTGDSEGNNKNGKAAEKWVLGASRRKKKPQYRRSLPPPPPKQSQGIWI